MLKEFRKTDYRGGVDFLADCDSLRAAIELEHVPHFTTVQKAADRLLKNRALLLKAIAHNVLILLCLMRFSTEQTCPLFFLRFVRLVPFCPMAVFTRAALIPIIRASKHLGRSAS